MLCYDGINFIHLIFTEPFDCFKIKGLTYTQYIGVNAICDVCRMTGSPNTALLRIYFLS